MLVTANVAPPQRDNRFDWHAAIPVMALVVPVTVLVAVLLHKYTFFFFVAFF